MPFVDGSCKLLAGIVYQMYPSLYYKWVWPKQANWGSPKRAAPLAPATSMSPMARSISDEEEHAGLTQQLELLKDFSRQLGQKVIERDGQLAGLPVTA